MMQDYRTTTVVQHVNITFTQRHHSYSKGKFAILQSKTIRKPIHSPAVHQKHSSMHSTVSTAYKFITNFIPCKQVVHSSMPDCIFNSTHPISVKLCKLKKTSEWRHTCMFPFSHNNSAHAFSMCTNHWDLTNYSPECVHIKWNEYVKQISRQWKLSLHSIENFDFRANKQTTHMDRVILYP